MSITFTYQDMQEIFGFAVERYKSYPARVILPGSDRELTVPEVRNLALYDAMLTHLNKRGALKEEFLLTDPISLQDRSSESIYEE